MRLAVAADHVFDGTSLRHDCAVIVEGSRIRAVIDAMPIGGNCTSFHLCGQDITVSGGRSTPTDGTLAGSVLDMTSAVRNCVRLLDMPLTQALSLASANPAAFLGIDNWLGHLRPGYRADMIALNPERVDVIAVWVAGEPCATA